MSCSSLNQLSHLRVESACLKIQFEPGTNGTTLSILGTDILLPKLEQASPFFGARFREERQIFASSFDCAWLDAARAMR